MPKHRQYCLNGDRHHSKCKFGWPACSEARPGAKCNCRQNDYRYRDYFESNQSNPVEHGRNFVPARPECCAADCKGCRASTRSLEAGKASEQIEHISENDHDNCLYKRQSKDEDRKTPVEDKCDIPDRACPHPKEITWRSPSVFDRNMFNAAFFDHSYAGIAAGKPHPSLSAARISVSITGNSYTTSQ